MCNLRAQEVWKNRRIAASSYLDVETIEYQYCLFNPTHFYFIAGYIMEDAGCYRDLKRMFQIRINLVDGYILT